MMRFVGCFTRLAIFLKNALIIWSRLGGPESLIGLFESHSQRFSDLLREI